MDITIPGFGGTCIAHAVFDYNGTIARDGRLINGVRQGITEFSNQLTFHVITADTFGFVKRELRDLPVVLTVIPKGEQDQKKLDYINALGPRETLAVGNGANDCLMLEKARIGIAVLGEEGLAVSSLTAADLAVKNILDVFGLLRVPERLIASLRT